MSMHRFADLASSRMTNVTAVVMAALNVVFSIVANAAFRVSARSATWSGVLTWQVVGNLAGFVTVVSLTILLRYVPLRIAFPVTTGMSVIGVQLVAAKWMFHEPINSLQWAGALLIGLGVFLVQR